MNPLDDIRIRELSSLISFEGLRVLDVGFGRAQLLYSLMRLGAIPFGVELDDTAITLAKGLGISDVFRGTLDDLDKSKEYDLVLMTDLVEHPLHPMHMLRSASSFLAPGGLLLIWTPNGDASRLDDNPITFRVDLEHMQYFTAHTCTYVATALDMQIIHLEALGFPYLTGIDKPLPQATSISMLLKQTAKSVPGVTAIRRLMTPDPRGGLYHLFCILQRAHL